MTELLAKSPHGARRLSLHRHLLDTEEAACELFRAGTRWADSYLRFFKLDPEEHGRFLKNLRVAALFHDIGKANAGFQTAMAARQFMPQPFRHEHLSALVLSHPAVVDWLRTARDLDSDIVTAAVLSHHLKATESGTHAVLHPRVGRDVALHLSDLDVQRTFDRVAHVLAIEPRVFTFPDRYDAMGSSWDAARELLMERAGAFVNAVRGDPRRRAMNMAVKAGVIVADSVASAMFRENLPTSAWIDEVAHAAAPA